MGDIKENFENKYNELQNKYNELLEQNISLFEFKKKIEKKFNNIKEYLVSEIIEFKFDNESRNQIVEPKGSFESSDIEEKKDTKKKKIKNTKQTETNVSTLPEINSLSYKDALKEMVELKDENYCSKDAEAELKKFFSNKKTNKNKIFKLSNGKILTGIEYNLSHPPLKKNESAK